MKKEIYQFITYLYITKKMSENTKISYERDLKKMALFLEERGKYSVKDVREIDLAGYIDCMERENFAAASISRSIASMRAFFQYLQKERIIDRDPAENLHPPKVEKHMPEILTIEDVDALLNQPDISTLKGMRDKAMLELLYATGMRVSELIRLNLKDINLNLGYVICHDDSKERVIPIGSVCRNALAQYMEQARDSFVKSSMEESLFTNCSGKSMSRQGFWKVLKAYADTAGIDKEITPQTLRHSFAVHMLQNGADIKSIQEMLGHSDISTTQIYLNVNGSKMREVYMKAHPRK